MDPNALKKRFRPGELAPVTGIYLVRHLPQHRAAHEAVIVRGEMLPSCRTCTTRISYEIVRIASHITHDWDFSGPHFALPHGDYANLRKSPRYKVQLPVMVQLGASPKKGCVQGTTEDLSESGMGAILEAKLGSDQEKVVIRVELGREDTPVLLQARLRYRSGLHHGFEFISLNDTQKTAILMMIGKQRPVHQPVGW